MLNRRINSYRNVTRFWNDIDKKDTKLSNFLPDFLIKKYVKEDGNPDNQKQDLFLEDENEDDGLEIQIDPYIINEKQCVHILINILGEQQF